MEQQLDLTKLSESDKKELNQVLTNEAQKSNIQQSEWFIFLSGHARDLYFTFYMKRTPVLALDDLIPWS